MVDIAVKQDGYAIEYVPRKFITKELCEEAIKTQRRFGYIIIAVDIF